MIDPWNWTTWPGWWAHLPPAAGFVTAFLTVFTNSLWWAAGAVLWAVYIAVAGVVAEVRYQRRARAFRRTYSVSLRHFMREAGAGRIDAHDFLVPPPPQGVWVSFPDGGIENDPPVTFAGRQDAGRTAVFDIDVAPEVPVAAVGARFLPPNTVLRHPPPTVGTRA